MRNGKKAVDFGIIFSSLTRNALMSSCGHKWDVKDALGIKDT